MNNVEQVNQQFIKCLKVCFIGFLLFSPLQSRSEPAAGYVVWWGMNYGAHAGPIRTTNGLVLRGDRPLSNVVALATTSGRHLALESDSSIYLWGFGGKDNRDLRGLTNIASLSADVYSWAITRDGKVAGLDSRFAGVMEQRASLSNVISMTAGDRSLFLALRRDGTVLGLSFKMFDQTTGHVLDRYEFQSAKAVRVGVRPLKDVVWLVRQNRDILAVKRDGTVLTISPNTELEFRVSEGKKDTVEILEYPVIHPKSGKPLSSHEYLAPKLVRVGDRILRNVISVVAGERHVVALRNDGTVVAWGTNDMGQLDIPEGLSNVISIAVGSVHNLALKKDGTVVAWGGKGIDYYGMASVPLGLSNVVAIAADASSSLAITTNRSVATRFLHTLQ